MTMSKDDAEVLKLVAETSVATEQAELYRLDQNLRRAQVDRAEVETLRARAEVAALERALPGGLGFK